MKNLGKSIAYVLRHAPESVGATLDSRGRIRVDTLASLMGVTVREILETVEADSKGRYKVEGGLIWAVQGHSFPVDLGLKQVTPETPLYHGTLTSTWKAFIKTHGLKRMSRQHVHLSGDVDTALMVASRRKGETVILVVDTQKAVRMGVRFFIADNGVFLSDDIPATCLQIVNL